MATQALQTLPAGQASITLDVVDNDGNPASVMDANQPFSVVGSLTVNAGGVLNGRFRLQLLGDARGDQFDGQVGPDAIVDITGDGLVPINITIPANTLPNPVQVGRPRQVVTLGMLVTYETDAGATTNLTGFVDLGTYLFS